MVGIEKLRRVFRGRMYNQAKNFSALEFFHSMGNRLVSSENFL